MTSTTVTTSPTGWTVTDATGAVLGSVTASALGFIAWPPAGHGRSLGGFTTMAAAVAALEGASK